MANMSSICRFVSSTLALGRSILLMTGMIVRRCFVAICTLATVCASTPLRRVDDQQRAFAGGQAARHFVGKIHVTGRVDQVQFVWLAVLGLVGHRHGMRLDRDAALAFQVHRIQHLLAHLAFLHRARRLQQAIRQRRLAVVDVRDDAEIPNVTNVHEGRTLPAFAGFV